MSLKRKKIKMKESVNENIKNAIEVLSNTYNNIYKMFNVIEEYCITNDLVSIVIIDNSTDWNDKIFKPNNIPMEHLIKTRISYAFVNKCEIKNIEKSKNEKIKKFTSKEVKIVEVVLNDEIPRVYYGKIKYNDDTQISSGKSQTASIYYNLKKDNLEELVKNEKRYISNKKGTNYIYKVKNLLDINNKEDIDKIIKELEVF